MRFPSVANVRRVLVAVNREVDPSDDADSDVEVRLQVYPDGAWAVRVGSSDYDQDHRGYWGSGYVLGGGRRFNATELAKDLIGQAKEQFACEYSDKAMP